MYADKFEDSYSCGGNILKPSDLLKDHEAWANRVCTRILSFFGISAIPVFFVLQNVPWRWRIILSIGSILQCCFLLFLAKNERTSKYTKYLTTFVLISFGFLMTLTMGEGNRSVPFYFFSILVFTLIYLTPKLILVTATGTILCHAIMICFFPAQILPSINRRCISTLASFTFFIPSLFIPLPSKRGNYWINLKATGINRTPIKPEAKSIPIPDCSDGDSPP